MSFLEEDLAVGLMLRLLFTPLFHDRTIIGRILSFLFRIVRIMIGITSFAMMTFWLFVIALIWFLTPILIFVLSGNLGILAKGIFFFGSLLFVRNISRPRKKLWQIKSALEIWDCSTIGLKDLNFVILSKTNQVKFLVSYLEKTIDDLSFVSQNDKTADLLQIVLEIGKKLDIKYLGPEHFFTAMIFNTADVENKLLKLDLNREDFLDTLAFLKKKEDLLRTVFIWDENFSVRHLKGTNRGWVGVPTPCLNACSEDLTKLASKEYLPDFIGRQDVVDKVVNILSLEKGTNVAIVGEPGSGRGALVSYLAKMIVKGSAPSALATKRLMKIDMTKLLANVKTQGELAERIKNIFEEVEYSGNIILYVDEIQNLGLGEAGAEFNLYSLMFPYLESSKTQFIAVTENSSFTRILEKNQSFAKLFAKIELPPAAVSETIEILKNRAIDNERRRKIKTSVMAIKKIAELSSEYIHDFVLPDAALKVYEGCLSRAKNGWITVSLAEEVVRQKTNIPVGEIGKEERKDLLNLEEKIHEKMIDQEEAVFAVCSTLRRAAAELRDKDKPIGSFLFVGPTGVGKTELAKILADVFFAERGHFVRFDMSEYQTGESISRLIGTPGEDGSLTETVRSHPYSLILLDEFEKADPKVLMLFLQILDDGRLTSGSGKVANFTDSIIIATSNAASLNIAMGLEKGRTLKDMGGEVKDELLRVFKPELMNRFDEVVLFKPLLAGDLQKIVSLKLLSLQKILKDKGFVVEFAEELIKELAEKGFDPVLGARPLRRLIQDTLEAKLSVLILENKLPKGEKFIVGKEFLP